METSKLKLTLFLILFIPSEIQSTNSDEIDCIHHQNYEKHWKFISQIKNRFIL